MAPSYLSDLIEEYKPDRSLRTSDMGLLKEKTARLKTYGQRAFSYSAPKLWNKLPYELRMKESLDAFKRSLKTHYFRIAYGD